MDGTCSAITHCIIACCSVVCCVTSVAAADDVTTADVTLATTAAAAANVSKDGSVAWNKLTADQKKGVVTVELNAVNISDISSVQQSVRSTVVNILNQKPSSQPTPEPTQSEARLRRRRESSGSAAATGDYSTEGVQLVAADPAVKDGRLRVPIVAQSNGGNVLHADSLKAKLQANSAKISDDTGAPVEAVYVGMPADMKTVDERYRRQSVWEQHKWMFIAVLILLLVALITLCLCCICFRCCAARRRRQTKQLPDNEQQPVEEMIAMSPASPLCSAPPPMKEAPNNSPAPPNSDEENGWIIPIDQLSPEELDQPDVQISRL